MSENLDPAFPERPESSGYPEFKEHPHPEFPHQPANPQRKRHDPVFYIGVAIAVLCILGALSITSFIAGFISATTLHKSDNTGYVGVKKEKQYGLYGRDKARDEVIGKIAIYQKGNDFQFSEQHFKMPAGKSIAWVNTTDQVQIIIADNNGPSTKIGPGAVTMMFIKESNKVYVFHLNSNSNASITIAVGKSN